MMASAVFLDRDGVIDENRSDYVKSWEEFEFIPGALDALKRLSESDHKIIVVTNQSAVGKGVITQQCLEEIHARMLEEVGGSGGRIDAIYACCHAPEDGCSCRKPNTLLFDLAAEAFDLDIHSSYMVGDSTKDVEAARRTRCKSILVATGHGGKDGLYDVKADFEVEDLSAAVDTILS